MTAQNIHQCHTMGGKKSSRRIFVFWCDYSWYLFSTIFLIASEINPPLELLDWGMHHDLPPAEGPVEVPRTLQFSPDGQKSLSPLGGDSTKAWQCSIWQPAARSQEPGANHLPARGLILEIRVNTGLLLPNAQLMCCIRLTSLCHRNCGAAGLQFYPFFCSGERACDVLRRPRGLYQAHKSFCQFVC